MTRLWAVSVAVVLALAVSGCSYEEDSSHEEYSTLSGAISRNDLPQVVAMLNAGTDPNEIDNRRGVVPIVIASRGGISAVVAALLAAGANPNLVAAEDRFTALMGAATRTDADGAEIVGMLIAAGADPCPTASVDREPSLFDGRFDNLTALEIARQVGNADSEARIAMVSSTC